MISFIKKYTIYTITAFLLLTITGCGEFFAKKPIEIEAMDIVRDVATIKENTEATNPVPAIYRADPQILETPGGVKLFYFTKHHAPDNLAKIVTDQLGNKCASSQAINQLIVNCKTKAEADNVIEFLKKADVLPIQVKIDCIIVEHYADVTMDWETTIQVDNLLGEDITLVGKKNSDGDLLPAFPGASLREELRSDFGLNVGYFNNGATGHIVNAVVDILVSRGYMKVLMNPTVETINGKKASIVSRDKVPITKIVSGKETDPYQITEYIWVEDKLEVTPYVYSDGSIGLVTKIMMGSKSTPEGVAQLPIITERSIDVQENRLKPGNSLIIGGFKKSEKRAVIRGIPFLKDLPLIGVLFSSKDFEERAKEITFILTPNISSNGIKYSKMIEQVREKMKEPEHQGGLEGIIADPLGTGGYTKEMERQAASEEIKRIQAQIEAAQTEREASEARERLKRYQAELHLESSRTKKVQGRLNEIQRQLKQIEDEKNAMLQQKEVAEKNAAQANQQAQKAQLSAKEASQKMTLTQKQLETAREEAEKLRQEAELLKKQLDESQKLHQEAELLRKQLEEAQKQQSASQPEEEAVEEVVVVEKVQEEQPAAEEAADEQQAKEESSPQTEEPQTDEQQTDQSGQY